MTRSSAILLEQSKGRKNHIPNDDNFEPYWLDEDDWLVTICPLPNRRAWKIELAMLTGISLFKCRMISRELSSEFLAKGRIPNEPLKFADVGLLYLLCIFPRLDDSLEEQCGQNVLGVMG